LFTPEEVRLWRVLADFEFLAADKYARNAPELLTTRKTAFVETLRSVLPAQGASEISGALEVVSRQLLMAAAATGRENTLLVQGLVLEPVGAILYETLEASPATSPDVHPMAVAGAQAGREVFAKVPALIRGSLGEGDPVFKRFSVANRVVLSHADQLGDVLERDFGAVFSIDFIDLIGQFTEELVPVCTGLGMGRSDVLGFLASSFMNG
jgi:hypothetical protein